MIARRSLLFAPANRQEVHGKALAAGPDIFCLDLEDAVPPHAKALARKVAVDFLLDAADGAPERAVRINALRSLDGIRDMAAILEAAPRHAVVFLPKVMDAGEVRLAHDLIAGSAPGLKLAVLIETATGLENAAAIMAASDRIAFAMFGAVDLAADLGAAMGHEPLLYARSRVVHAAALAGIDVLDVPCLAYRDEAAISAEAGAARALGFTGKAAIHPAGLAAIHAAFTPTPQEIARARAIVAAFRASPNGLATVDGKLVEKPVVRAMERVLAISGRDGAKTPKTPF
jgi:citrate lyase subunit beta/citryl-CoA lyase/(S)-citramalyl-CoA lyase